MRKVKFLHKTFSFWSVDSRIVFLCCHSLYGLNGTKNGTVVLQLACGLFAIWVGWWFGRRCRGALLIEMLVGMSCYLILLCQTGGSASDPLKAIISLLEASKCSGGLLQALTCYLFYLHPKI